MASRCRRTLLNDADCNQRAEFSLKTAICRPQAFDRIAESGEGGALDSCFEVLANVAGERLGALYPWSRYLKTTIFLVSAVRPTIRRYM